MSAQEIRTCYRKSCVRTHPDKGGSSADFRRVVAAYETLCDPKLRALADQERWSADEAMRQQEARAKASTEARDWHASLVREAEEWARNSAAEAKHAVDKSTASHESTLATQAASHEADMAENARKHAAAMATGFAGAPAYAAPPVYAAPSVFHNTTAPPVSGANTQTHSAMMKNSAQAHAAAMAQQAAMHTAVMAAARGKIW